MRNTARVLVMIMIIFIPKKDTLQIMVTNIQYSPNLRMPVKSYKKTTIILVLVLVLALALALTSVLVFDNDNDNDDDNLYS